MTHQRLFQIVLFVYPRSFRQEYGREMEQFFRDCYRAEKMRRGRLGTGGLWLRTFLDLARTAACEHLENLGKDNPIMKSQRNNVLALLGSLVIVVIAFLLLSYGRKNEVSFILIFGRSLDALVSAGIVANVIAFLLIAMSHLNRLRVAFWTLLIVHGALLGLSVLIGSKVDPTFRLTSIVVAYLVSFVFWFSLHWIWSKAVTPPAVTNES